MDYEQSLFFLIVRQEWSEKVRSRENKQNSRGLEGTFDLFSARGGTSLYYTVLLDSTRAAIGQFNGPYSTVPPAKSKTLFLRAPF